MENTANNLNNIINMTSKLNKGTDKGTDKDMSKSGDESNKKLHVLWIYNPSILFDPDFLYSVWPQENMSREEKINAISRLIIFITLFGLVIFRDLKLLLTSILTLAVLLLTYFFLNRKSNNELLSKLKEGFSDEGFYIQNKANFTNPEEKNPIMNVLLPEIQDNPNRLKAAPAYNKAVEKEINESTKDFVKKNFNGGVEIDEKLFSDLGDKMQFEQSMRQFYATPNTQVPNNQKEFAQFCYGNMASCKDGDTEMCLKATYRHTNT